MASSRRDRGFTLIEMMIIVVVVSILGMLALVSYRHLVQNAFLMEANDTVNGIRAAQESFRSENGGYLNVSTNLGVGFDYPQLTPGKYKTQWGAACGACNSSAGWNALSVAPSAPVMFGYSTIASVTSTVGAPVNSLMVNGTALDLSHMTVPWYLVEADGDTDGNGVFCNVFGMSGTNQLFVNREGE